jgi:hypothetical protein
MSRNVARAATESLVGMIEIGLVVLAFVAGLVLALVIARIAGMRARATAVAAP